METQVNGSGAQKLGPEGTLSLFVRAPGSAAAGGSGRGPACYLPPGEKGSSLGDPRTGCPHFRNAPGASAQQRAGPQRSEAGSMMMGLVGGPLHSLWGRLPAVCTRQRDGQLPSRKPSDAPMTANCGWQWGVSGLGSCKSCYSKYMTHQVCLGNVAVCVFLSVPLVRAKKGNVLSIPLPSQLYLKIIHS